MKLRRAKKRHIFYETWVSKKSDSTSTQKNPGKSTSKTAPMAEIGGGERNNKKKIQKRRNLPGEIKSTKEHKRTGNKVAEEGKDQTEMSFTETGGISEERESWRMIKNEENHRKKRIQQK